MKVSELSKVLPATQSVILEDEQGNKACMYEYWPDMRIKSVMTGVDEYGPYMHVFVYGVLD